MRITSRFWLYRPGRRRGQVERLAVARGHACFWPRVCLTEPRDGLVQLAVARAGPGQDGWEVLREEPTEEQTCREDGLRFDLAENFWDDTSNGFQGASSLMRAAQALTRLCWGLAMTTRSLVAQGPEVVKQGQRRGVDSPGLRGQSDMKSGWHGVK
jgi:hypothetical protein